jgi:hypothetical protein
MNEFTRTWVFQKRTGMPGDDSGSLGFLGEILGQIWELCSCVNMLWTPYSSYEVANSLSSLPRQSLHPRKAI